MTLMMISSLSHSEIRTSLVGEGLGFISEDYENTSQKSFGMIGAQLISDSKSSDLLQLNIKGLYAVGQSQLSYLNLKELSFNFAIDDTSKASIGRKLNSWSKIDDVWNLGYFQPQMRWNTLAPENQGLSGIFWERNQTRFKIRLFGSPIFLPDQGPNYDIKDGQFQNSNPWFPSPPQNVSFQNGVLLPIDYNIEKPETSDVIFQTSYGAQLELGDEQGFYSQVSGMYKPSNQLALGYRVVGVVDRVRVDILPKVYYETDFATDIGYRTTDMDLSVSVVYSKPKSPEYEPQYNAPIFEDSTTGSFWARFKVETFRFGIGYLDTSGGQVSEKGPDASPDRKALSQRLSYRQAYQIEAAYNQTFNKSYRIDLSVNYKESTFEPFRIISAKSKLNLRGPWAFWIDAILVDTEENSESYFESFKNRDLVVLGASYDI